GRAAVLLRSAREPARPPDGPRDGTQGHTRGSHLPGARRTLLPGQRQSPFPLRFQGLRDRARRILQRNGLPAPREQARLDGYRETHDSHSVGAVFSVAPTGCLETVGGATSVGVDSHGTSQVLPLSELSGPDPPGTQVLRPLR